MLSDQILHNESNFLKDEIREIKRYIIEDGFNKVNYVDIKLESIYDYGRFHVVGGVFQNSDQGLNQLLYDGRLDIQINDNIWNELDDLSWDDLISNEEFKGFNESDKMDKFRFIVLHEIGHAYEFCKGIRSFYLIYELHRNLLESKADEYAMNKLRKYRVNNIGVDISYE